MCRLFFFVPGDCPCLAMGRLRGLLSMGLVIFMTCLNPWACNRSNADMRYPLRQPIVWPLFIITRTFIVWTCDWGFLILGLFLHICTWGRLLSVRSSSLLRCIVVFFIFWWWRVMGCFFLCQFVWIFKSVGFYWESCVWLCMSYWWGCGVGCRCCWGVIYQVGWTTWTRGCPHRWRRRWRWLGSRVGSFPYGDSIYSDRVYEWGC